MQPVSARNHLNQAARSALSFFDSNDKQEAFKSFLDDVSAHPDTAWIAAHPFTLMLLESGWKDGREEFRKMMEGFAVDDQPREIPSTNPAPINTDSEAGAMQVLYGAAAGGSIGDAVMAQESAGQSSLVNSDTLPSSMSDKDREALERAGVVFGDLVPGDEMFVNVTLPEGWRKVASDHSMWSYLLDNKGRKRASMFYKAAFYDRHASLSTVCRFNIVDISEEHPDENVIVICVTDGGTSRVFSTRAYPDTVQRHEDDYVKQHKEAINGAKTWLGKYYPNWQDASEYWD